MNDTNINDDEGYPLELSEELDAAKQAAEPIGVKPWGDLRLDRSTFGWAYARSCTWHCGAAGKCKPCGKLYRNSDGVVTCRQHDLYGCPSKAKQEAHVSHDWGRTQCRVCGERRGWISLRTRQWYKTQRLAALAGEDTSKLVRAPRAKVGENNEW